MGNAGDRVEIHDSSARMITDGSRTAIDHSRRHYDAREQNVSANRHVDARLGLGLNLPSVPRLL